MKELVRKIVQALVEFPEKVDIREMGGSKTRILKIKVSKQDVGKLSGKKGRNIMALRNIVLAARKGEKGFVIEVVEERPYKSQVQLYKGRIKALIEGNPYGFIEDEDGRTLFFHSSSLKGMGRESLFLNQPVGFEVEESPKGIKAVNVLPISIKNHRVNKPYFQKILPAPKGDNKGDKEDKN